MLESILYPTVITIDNHRACNAKCRMCPTQNIPLTSGAMSDVVFDTLFNQLLDFKEKINFVQFGVHGEPLLDTKLEERVARLTDEGIKRVWIATNGAAMPKKRAEQFLAANVEAVIFSVDGITKDTYEKIRIGLKYEMVVKNVLEFISVRNRSAARTRVVMRFISQARNKDEYAEWATFWLAHLKPQHDSLHFVQMHNWAFNVEGIDDYGNAPCTDVTEGVLVSSDGSVPLCCLDYNGEYNFGNVLNTHILNIFNSDARVKIKKVHEAGRRGELKKCDKCYLPEYNKDERAGDPYYEVFEQKLYWNTTDSA